MKKKKKFNMNAPTGKEFGDLFLNIIPDKRKGLMSEECQSLIKVLKLGIA